MSTKDEDKNGNIVDHDQFAPGLDLWVCTVWPDSCLSETEELLLKVISVLILSIIRNEIMFLLNIPILSS